MLVLRRSDHQRSPPFQVAHSFRRLGHRRRGHNDPQHETRAGRGCAERCRNASPLPDGPESEGSGLTACRRRRPFGMVHVSRGDSILHRISTHGVFLVRCSIRPERPSVPERPRSRRFPIDHRMVPPVMPAGQSCRRGHRRRGRRNPRHEARVAARGACASAAARHACRTGLSPRGPESQPSAAAAPWRGQLLHRGAKTWGPRPPGRAPGGAR